MAKKQIEKNPLKKGRANFEVVGEVGKIGDYTYSVEKTSDSGYKYSSLRLNVKVAEDNSVSMEAMGGYFPNRVDNVIRVGAKDDPKERIEIAWVDRLKESILDAVHSMSLITIALERDVNNKLVYKHFLSWYDAIDYVQGHLQEGMRIKVRGNLTYSEYNNTVQVRKNIQTIFLANDEEKNHATFTQTILTQAGNADKSHAKEDKIIDIFANIVDYEKGIGGNRAFSYPFKLRLKDGEEKKSLAMVKVIVPDDKKILREITVEGHIVEGAEVTKFTADDIPDELRELIDCGIYTEEEILDKMVVKGNRVMNMYIDKPAITVAKEGQPSTLMRDDGKYTPDDLIVEIQATEPVPQTSNKAEDEELDAMVADLVGSDDISNAVSADEIDDDLSWMKELD